MADTTRKCWRVTVPISVVILIVHSVGIIFVWNSELLDESNVGTRRKYEHKKEEMSSMSILPVSNPKTFGDDDICAWLETLAIHSSAGSAIPTAASIWTFFKGMIVNSTMSLEFEQGASNMATKQKLESWGDYLFDQVSVPDRMENAIALQKERRMAFSHLKALLQQKLSVNRAGQGRLSDDAQPLRILILGGSVPAGTHCAKNPFGLAGHDGPKLRYSCMWPNRLNALLSSILGKGVVSIQSMALGGTSSDMGALVVKFQLWKDRPDIILVDYAANDFRPDATGNVQDAETLALAVEEERNCTTGLPLLVYIDEFMAWPRSTVVQHFDMQYKLQQIADYHDFTLLSYSRAFRDYVLADLRDTTLKGSWSPPDSHGGRSQHIIITWMIAYSMLRAAFDHCFIEQTRDQPEIIRTRNAANEKNAAFPSLPQLPDGPKPELNPSLTFDRLSSEWNESKCSKNTVRECEFIWVANRIGSARTASRKGDITAFLEPKLVSNIGWKEGGDFERNKHGWLTDQANSTFSLEWTVENHDVKSITILSMKSYGEKWKDSYAQLTVTSTPDNSNISSQKTETESSTFKWSGFHDSETSISLPFSFDLPSVIKKGEKIHADFWLLSGSSFKISGMMFCAT